MRGMDATKATVASTSAAVCSRHIVNCRSGCALSSHRGIAGNAAHDARYVTAASAMPTSDEYSLLTMYRLSRI